MRHQEIEAKFYVSEHETVTARLSSLGATCTHQQYFERNWRFDRPDGALSSSGIVLRLRTDPQATLTVKRAGSDPLKRTEIEVELGEAEAAVELLELLGYEPLAIYEKRRAEYAQADTLTMLDELPFGCFVEIESTSVDGLRQQAAALGLNWSLRIQHSYLWLFQQLAIRRNLPFRDATFDNFDSLPPVTAAELQLQDALIIGEPAR